MLLSIRRRQQVRLDSISLREFLSWGYSTEAEHAEFTKEDRYRDAMSVCYYETRALKSTPFAVIENMSFVASVKDFILDFFLGRPSNRLNSSETSVPWRMDYDFEFDDETKHLFFKDDSIRQAWMYENLFGRLQDENTSMASQSVGSLREREIHVEPSAVERLLRFGFMVDIADNVLSTISEFCRRGEDPPNEGDISNWSASFSWYTSVVEQNSSNSFDAKFGLLTDPVLSAPVRTNRLARLYEEAFARLPESHKTSSEVQWLNWYEVTHMAVETIELFSVSRGLFEPGDGLQCNNAYVPALWNALFCRQIIEHRRSNGGSRMGYALSPQVIDALFSKEAILYWGGIERQIKGIVKNFINCANRKPLQEEMTTQCPEEDTRAIFQQLRIQCNELVRSAFAVALLPLRP